MSKGLVLSSFSWNIEGKFHLNIPAVLSHTLNWYLQEAIFITASFLSEIICLIFLIYSKNEQLFYNYLVISPQFHFSNPLRG